jgi:hypothetical protein
MGGATGSGFGSTSTTISGTGAGRAADLEAERGRLAGAAFGSVGWARRLRGGEGWSGEAVIWQ